MVMSSISSIFFFVLFCSFHQLNDKGHVRCTGTRLSSGVSSPMTSLIQHSVTRTSDVLSGAEDFDSKQNREKKGKREKREK